MLVEKRDSIGIITFDRPEALNALNTGVLSEISAAIDQFENDLEIRVIVFTGNGKAFISGADLDEMKDLRGQAARDFIDKGTSLFRRIELLELPTIAAINGFCFGGGLELALCTDIRLASEKASFSFPEATLGIIPGFSGTQRLPRTVGKSNAKEM
ncbi:MAG: enoyl-CoA hydratase/isomerase family protein, partial [Youngiibacter sp.]|nr:enoyl-CoA hydratase/isomerase family protein [Youngiibacter sp.]